MPTADSARRDWPEVAAEPRRSSVMRANVPAADGQIPPDLTRAVCGIAVAGIGRVLAVVIRSVSRRRAAPTQPSCED